MREHPFASLISLDDAGAPYVTHLPLHHEERSNQLVLLGHCARGNPHWRYLQTRPQALVTFMGPHAYLSPKVYPDLARVPTWNYLAVHCTVQATLSKGRTQKTNCSRVLSRTMNLLTRSSGAAWAPNSLRRCSPASSVSSCV